MKKINNAIKKWFFISLTFSILFVLGIPMIVFGAILKKWILMSFGIAFVGFGFYGLPFFWIAYGEKFTYKRLIFAVTYEHILSVNDLAMHLNKDTKTIQNLIYKSIHKQYLVGYLFDGNLLTLNTNKNPNEKLFESRCDTCGANFYYKFKEEPLCPYCGKLNK